MHNEGELKRTLLTIAASLMLAVFLSFLASPAISPIYGMYEGSNFTYDPALFKYEALAILSGQKPYIDFYDHKGIWHLGVYLLAMLINERYGLLILEIISGTITMFFYLETIKELTSSFVQRHIAVFIFMIMRFLVGTGATIGMWILPFVSVYLFFYTKAIKENKENLFLYGSIFLGLAVAFSFNSRPLDMVYVWGGAFFLLIHLIIEKKYGLLIKNAAIAAISFAIPAIIISAIAISNGFFNEMIQSMVFDNFRYAAKNNGILFEEVAFRTVSLIVSFMYLLMYLILRKKNENKAMNLFVFVMGISSFLPLVFMIKFFSHFLASTPLLGMTIVFYMESFPKKKEMKRKIALSITGLAASLLSFTPVIYHSSDLLGDFSYSKNEKDVEALLATIPNEDRIDGNVYVIDCSCAVYNLLGVVGDAKYYCNQTWWSYDNPNVMDASMEYVKESKPKYVVIWKESRDKWLEILNDSYTLENDSAERFFIYKINS